MTFPTTLPTSRHTPLTGGATLRWGVMAPGTIANSWVTTVHAHTGQSVVAVASRSLPRAEEFASRHGIPRAYGSYEMLAADPEVDAVYIAAPHTEHVALALIAIAAGKHVLVEKPIAPSAAEAQLIVDAARAAGVFAMEAMWSRFLPQTSIVEQLLADGVLGEVVQLTADFGALFDYEPESRWFNPALAGGALLDIGVYPAWFAHFVLGEPSAVTARGSLAPTGVDRRSVLTLEYPSHALGVVTMTMDARTPMTASISGSAARVEYTGEFFAPSGFRLIAADGSELGWQDETGWGWGDGLAYQAVAMAQDVAEGLTESARHPLETTLAVLRVLDAAKAQLGAA